MAGKNTPFSKVTVDVANRKRSKFNLSHSFTSSMGFGEVFPIHCQKMIPDSKHVCSAKSILRLDPMVAPTSQGRITCKQWHSFVGLSDLFRNHGAFLTKQPFSKADGVGNFTFLPRVRLSYLSSFCLVGCQFTPYRSDGNGNYTLVTDSTEIANDIAFLDSCFSSFTWLTNVNTDSTFTARWPNFSAPGLNWSFVPRMFGLKNCDSNIPCGNIATNKSHFWTVNPISIDSADFVFEHQLTDGHNFRNFAFAVKLSSFGKRIHDILIALGYGVHFNSTEVVDATRLFAFYVAYYGSFGLSLYTNYESTACSQILRGYENGRNSFNNFSYLPSTGVFGSGDDLNDLFCLFMTDLADAYVTDPVDYVSAHRKKDVSGTDDVGFVQNIVRAVGNPTNTTDSFGGSPSQSEPSSVVNQTGALYIDNVKHTQVDADLLKLLYKSVNRQTVAGRRIAELLRAGGYGSYVDEMKSHFLGYTEFDVDISDVNVTADGVNTVTGKNSNLGEYVGKGFGSSNDEDTSFSYETDEFGYWITLCSIVPESDYVQGCDMTVFEINRESQYNKEYDSLGYEIQPKAIVKQGNDYNYLDASGNTSNNGSSQSFGLVPRYMRYKVGHSVVAGNFKLRSRRDAYLPFVLSRWLDAGDIHQVGAPTTDSVGVTYQMRKSVAVEDLPIAGNAWRFVNLYPWLANFSRIFAFSETTPLDYTIASVLARWKYCSFHEDYFMLFCRIIHNCYAPMLPIEDSWSTTDDNDGKGVPMMQA